MKSIILFVTILSSFNSCQTNPESQTSLPISPGAWQTDEYLEIIKGKSIAVVVNQSSTIQSTHLVDSLISLGVDIKAIFAPEHGFRGQAADGEIIDNETDSKTGLPIVSLYGNHKNPLRKNHWLRKV